MEAQIADAAERVWRGLEARVELWNLIREHKDDPDLGPTKIAEITDYLYRPEHVSRIASGPPPKEPKRRLRAVDKSA